MRSLMPCGGPSKSWLKLIVVGETGEYDYGFYPIPKPPDFSHSCSCQNVADLVVSELPKPLFAERGYFFAS